MNKQAPAVALIPMPVAEIVGAVFGIQQPLKVDRVTSPITLSQISSLILLL